MAGNSSKSRPRDPQSKLGFSRTFTPHLESLEDRLVLSETQTMGVFPVEKLDMEIAVPIIPPNVTWVGDRTVVQLRDIIPDAAFADGIVTTDEVMTAISLQIPAHLPPYGEPFGINPPAAVLPPPDGLIVDERELPRNAAGTGRLLPIAAAPSPLQTITIRGAIDDATDEDFFFVELKAGDVLSGAMIGILVPDPDDSFPDQIRLDANLSVLAPNGRAIWDNEDAWLVSGFPGLYPPESPLARLDPFKDFGFGVLDAGIGIVIPEDGVYAIVAGSFPAANADVDAFIDISATSFGPYELTLSIFRPGLEQAPIGAHQKLFIDFDGAIDALGDSFLPLSDALVGWGLAATDLDAVIDSILATIEENFNDIRFTGNNGDFERTGIPGQYDYEILNSRDHGTMFIEDPTFDRDPTVSRVVIGLNVNSFTGALGLAQYIDVGNYSFDDTAWVDVTSLGSLDPLAEIFGLDLNFVPRATGLSIIPVIGRSVGMVATHEIGHYIGLWHTDPLTVDGAISIIDSGAGLPEAMLGLGPDGIFGTGDDLDVDFITDRYFFLEEVGDTIFEDDTPAFESVPETVGFGLSTGKQFVTIGQEFGVIAIDVSQSMLDTQGRDINGDGVLDHRDDINSDGVIGSVLDLAIAELLAAHARSSIPFPFRAPTDPPQGIFRPQADVIELTEADRFGELPANIALVIFGRDAAAVDMSIAPGIQLFTHRSADADGNGVADFEQILKSLRIGHAGLYTPVDVDPSRTFYDAALTLIDGIVASTEAFIPTAFDPETYFISFRPLTGENFPGPPLVDNDVLIFSPLDGAIVPGHFEAEVDTGGALGTDAGQDSLITAIGDISGLVIIPDPSDPFAEQPIREFRNFLYIKDPHIVPADFPLVDFAPHVLELEDTFIDAPATLVAPDLVVSQGHFFMFSAFSDVNFDGDFETVVRQINWEVQTSIATDTTILRNRVFFWVESVLLDPDDDDDDDIAIIFGDIGDFWSINFMNQEIGTPAAGPNDDLLFLVDDAAIAEMLNVNPPRSTETKLMTIGAGEGIGFAHTAETPVSLNLATPVAEFEGWAADDMAPLLRAGILALTPLTDVLFFNEVGVVDGVLLTGAEDYTLPLTGPGDVATAFAWSMPNSTQPTIDPLLGIDTRIVVNSFLELNQTIPNLMRPVNVLSNPVVMVSDGSGRLGDVALVPAVGEPIATMFVGPFHDVARVKDGFDFSLISILSSMSRTLRPGGPFLQAAAFSADRPGPGSNGSPDGGFTPAQSVPETIIEIPQPIARPDVNPSEFAEQSEFLNSQVNSENVTFRVASQMSSGSSSRRDFTGGEATDEQL